ncbi:Miro-like protein [Necator americanus]|uniref:Miro-like protein n=1 Tax=Necator americanus TaxID=51031 RepID=W2T495_NECAM|nr:Miro-like protein [Necator americanus]ETN76066.1 Miro-like protein [Necator americanus]
MFRRGNSIKREFLDETDRMMMDYVRKMRIDPIDLVFRSFRSEQSRELAGTIFRRINEFIFEFQRRSPRELVDHRHQHVKHRGRRLSKDQIEGTRSHSWSSGIRHLSGGIPDNFGIIGQTTISIVLDQPHFFDAKFYFRDGIEFRVRKYLKKNSNGEFLFEFIILLSESDYLPADNSSRRCVSAPTHELLTRPANPPKTAPLCMGRAMRVVVVGGRRVGKTAILRQVACFEDITSKKYEPTIDDTYQVLLEEGDRPREILIFHDTGGLADGGPPELKRPYLQVADAFVLVYSVADHESFNRIDLLKKFIEKQFGKDRKEVPIVALGNMRDLAHRKVDSDFAYSWAARERGIFVSYF